MKVDLRKFSLLPFFKSEFNLNVGKVMSGTLLSQSIVLLITPILTRIYTPEDFSKLALYISMVLILSVFATGKYEKAIILPKQDKEAITLVVVAGILSLIIGTFFLLIFILFKNQVVSIFNVEGISKWLIFIPITIFAAAFYNILNTWFNRKKKYLNLSGNKVIYAGLNGTLKIGFQKVLFMGAFGLVLSEAISYFVATLIFGKKFIQENGTNFFRISRQELVKTIKKYKSYPLYSVPSDFINVFARELPVLMLSGYYGPAIVGFYMLNKRVLDAPLYLVSNSVLEVFRQKASEDFNKYGNCRLIYISTLKKLALIAIIPFTILFFIAPILFAFIFGEEWIISGEFVQIFSIMYFFRFISSPLTYVFYITNKLNLNLVMQIIMLGIVWLCMFVGGHFFIDSKYTMMLLSIGYSFIYIVYLIISFFLSTGKIEKTF